MQKVAGSQTVSCLIGDNFPALVRSVGNKVGDLLDRPNIAMLTKVVDTPLLEMFIAVQITNLIDGVNIDQRLNIQGHQVPIIAAQLVEQYPTESLEDFVLCFKRGATGFYGTIYNLDASVLNLWMKAYLEEKYQIIEAEHSKAKKEEYDTLGQVDYAAYIERKERERQQATENPKAPENAKANELERLKLEYFNSVEYRARKATQDQIMRAASEFYNNRPEIMKELKLYEDVNGFEIPALDEQDAEKIYDIALNTKVSEEDKNQIYRKAKI